jgi:hypothetical protein
LDLPSTPRTQLAINAVIRQVGARLNLSVGRKLKQFMKAADCAYREVRGCSSLPVPNEHDHEKPQGAAGRWRVWRNAKQTIEKLNGESLKKAK